MRESSRPLGGVTGTEVPVRWVQPVSTGRWVEDLSLTLSVRTTAGPPRDWGAGDFWVLFSLPRNNARRVPNGRPESEAEHANVRNFRLERNLKASPRDRAQNPAHGKAPLFCRHYNAGESRPCKNDKRWTCPHPR